LTSEAKGTNKKLEVSTGCQKIMKRNILKKVTVLKIIYSKKKLILENNLKINNLT